MFIVSIVALGVLVLVVAHSVVVPLVKRRAVLIRGIEGAALGALVIVVVAGFSPWALISLPLYGGAIWWWRPWLALGLHRDAVRRAVVKAAGMTRIKRRDAAAAAFVLGETSSLRVLRLAPVVQLLILRSRTGSETAAKKLSLFRNVLRKTVQNYPLGSS
jgi:hypothetical protein